MYTGTLELAPARHHLRKLSKSVEEQPIIGWHPKFCFKAPYCAAFFMFTPASTLIPDHRQPIREKGGVQCTSSHPGSRSVGWS